MITDQEKIRQYEAFFHGLQMYQLAMNSKAISKLISNACDWSYAHRVGNGQLSNEEQQAIIDRAFNKLLDV